MTMLVLFDWILKLFIALYLSLSTDLDPDPGSALWCDPTPGPKTLLDLRVECPVYRVEDLMEEAHQ